MAYTNGVFYLDPEGGSDAARTALTSCTASNPSGSITRINKAGHGLVTGAVVDLSAFSTWLNSAWKITVVDVNNFDLDGAVWQSTPDASGTVTPRGGSSKADAWKTITSGASVSRHQAGDTIRIMASPDPVSLGNATWTNPSDIVTLATAKNANVCTCESAWTPSANVTASTSAANYKQGSASVSLAVASAFTTGKIAYFATGALDLSAYQQISLWIRTSANLSANALKLQLCSDTAGATVVNDLTLTAVTLAANTWTVITLDAGAALGSNINSIALTAVSDPGVVTILLDNIVACKAPGASDEITHLTLIGKQTADEPNWYPLNGIDGANLILGGATTSGKGSSDTVVRNYRGGPTETVTTYARNPVDLRKQLIGSSACVISKSGTDGNPITYSGGWDRTNMTTQSGETWWSGSHWAGSPFSQSGFDFIRLEKMGYAHTVSSPLANATFATFDVAVAGISGCAQLAWSTLGDYGGRIRIDQMTNSNGIAMASSVEGRIEYTLGPILGCPGNALTVVASANGIAINGAKIANSGGYGLTSNSPGYSLGEVIVNNVEFSNNVTADVASPSITNSFGSLLRLNNCLFNSTTKIGASNLRTYGDRIICHKYNQTADDHRVFAKAWSGQTDASVRHTASGIAWRLNPTNSTSCNSYAPAFIELGRIAFAAGSLVTIRCWCRRSHTGITAGIKIPGGQIAGVPDTLAAEMTAGADTWEQLTLTFTPTEAGVLEVTGYAYGGTTYSAYFDDLSASQ